MGLFRGLDPIERRDAHRHDLKMDRDEFAWRQRREIADEKREDRARELRIKAAQQQQVAAQRAADQREKDAAKAEAAAWSRPVTRYSGGTSKSDRMLGEPLIVEHHALPMAVALLPPVGSGAPAVVNAAEFVLDTDPERRDDPEWISTVGKPVHAAFKVVDQRYGGLLSKLRDHKWWRDVCKAAGVVLTSTVDEPRKTPRGLPVTRKVTTHDLPTITDLRIAEDGLRIRIGARVGDTAVRWAKGLDTLRAAFKSAGANASQMRVFEDRSGNIVLALDDAPSAFPLAIAPPAVAVAQSVVEAKRRYHELTWSLGVDSKGHIIAPSVKNVYHALVVGETGSGKSVYLSGLIEAWRPFARVFLVDPKGSDYTALENAPGVVMRSENAAQHAVLVGEVLRELQRRQVAAATAKRDGAADAFDFIPVLLVLDEFTSLQTALKRQFGVKGVEAFMGAIDDLMRLGRAFAIHIVIGSQDLYKDSIPVEIQGNAQLLVALGQVTDRTLMSKFIPDALSEETKRVGQRINSKKKGRALYVDTENNRVREVQTYYAWSPGTTSLDPDAPAKVRPPTDEVRAAWEAADRVCQSMPLLFPRLGIKVDGPDWTDATVEDLLTVPTIALDGPNGPISERVKYDHRHGLDWIGAGRLLGGTTAPETLEEMSAAAPRPAPAPAAPTAPAPALDVTALNEEQRAELLRQLLGAPVTAEADAVTAPQTVSAFDAAPKAEPPAPEQTQDPEPEPPAAVGGVIGDL